MGSMDNLDDNDNNDKMIANLDVQEDTEMQEEGGLEHSGHRPLTLELASTDEHRQWPMHWRRGLSFSFISAFFLMTAHAIARSRTNICFQLFYVLLAVALFPLLSRHAHPE